jgi:putative endopeptidase
MLKPTSLLLTGLLASGTAFAKPLPIKSPASQDTAKPPAEQSPSSVAGESPASADKKNPLPLDPKNMDASVKPQDDFYLYANGTWIKNNPIPPEFSRWAAFNELDEKNKAALHEIAEKAAAAAPKDSKKSNLEKAAADVQKVGDFYASGMNEKAVDAARVKPLEAELKRIDAMKDRKDVLKEIGHLH